HFHQEDGLSPFLCLKAVFVRDVFFEADAMTVEDPPDRANPRLLLTFLKQTVPDLFQSKVGFLLHQRKQPVLMFFQRRSALTLVGPGFIAAGLPKPLRPADRRRISDHKLNRRVKMALRMAKLSTVKTLTGFDFSFQPSLERNRFLALAQLDFIERNEVIHFLGPHGTGKSHLATALGVEAVKAGRSVYFASLADIVSVLARAERERQLRERIRL